MRRIADSGLKEAHIAQYALRDYFSEETIRSFDLQSYDIGEYVYRQDEEITTFHLLLDGLLQVDYLFSNGVQTVLALVEPLFTLGDLELFGKFPAVKNVRVVEASLLLSVPMSIIQQNEEDNPHFLRLILHQMVGKLDSMSEQMIQLSWPLEYRLGLYLLEQLKVEGPILTLVPRESLAGLLGTSVRHLNRTLKLLSQKSLIDVHYKTLTIADAEKLADLIEEFSHKRT